MPLAIDAACPVDAGVQDFKECLKNLRDGHHHEGLSRVRRALEVAPQNPFYMSYAGLLTALAENRFTEAETLCKVAVAAKRNHAQPYLNLAEVYVQARRPFDAIETLERGMMSVGRDLRLRRSLENIGIRREPVLPSLRRSHFLNRVFGRLRHRLLGPLKAK